jgi:DNA-binding MarR family transcriptional regulator
VTKAEAVTPDLKLEPALEFLQQLWALNHALESRSSQMVRALGVTGPQRLFLRCIGKYPGLTGSQLARTLHLDRGTVSVGLRRLIARGLVVQNRDPADHRRIALRLTAKGKQLDKPDEVTAEYVVEQVLAKVPRTQVTQAKALLRTLAARLIG